MIENNPPSSLPLRPQFYVPMSPPTWTRILLGCIIVVFVAMILYGGLVYGDWNGTENGYVLIDFGAKVNQYVAAGEIWRLFTATFLHIGVIHLLFNLYALHSLGPLVEGFFGSLRFLAIYLLAGLFGSLASFALSPALSAGASGAIFGLIGAATVYFLRYRENFGSRGRAILQNMLVVLAINLIFGFSMPGIDNWGHIGGLIGGALTAVGVLPRYRSPIAIRLGPQAIEEESRVTIELLWVVGCAVLWFVGVQWVSSGQLFE